MHIHIRMYVWVCVSIHVRAHTYVPCAKYLENELTHCKIIKLPPTYVRTTHKSSCLCKC